MGHHKINVRSMYFVCWDEMYLSGSNVLFCLNVFATFYVVQVKDVFVYDTRIHLDRDGKSIFNTDLKRNK